MLRPGRHGTAAILAAIGVMSLTAGAVELDEAQPFTVRLSSLAGSPLENARVWCIDSDEPASWSVGADGVLDVRRNCARIRCTADDHVALELEVTQAGVHCELAPGSVVRAGFAGGRCEGECSLTLRSKASELTAAREGNEFRMPPVPPGSYELTIGRSGDDWACRARLSLTTPGLWPVSIDWREPSALHGRVTKDALPLEGVVVRSFRHPPDSPRTVHGAWTCGPDETDTQTAEDGRFELGPVDATVSWFVLAGELEDPRGIAATLVESPEEIELALNPAIHVTGTVVDDEDETLPCEIKAEFADELGAALAARLEDEVDRSAECDERGRFLLGPFYPATTEVLVFPVGGRLLFLSVDPPPGATTVDLGRIRVTRGLPVSVRVTTENGTPIEGAKVRLTASEPVEITDEGTTDEDGWVEIDATNPLSDFLRVNASADGYLEGQLNRLSIEDAPFELALEPAGAIRGRVVGPDGEPIGDADVDWSVERRRRGDGATSDSDGSWELLSARPGAGKLVASADGYRDSPAIDLTVNSGQTVDAPDLELASANRIEGVVVSPSGSPVSGAVVITGRTRRPFSETISDDRGEFALPWSPESNSLTARKEGFGQARLSPIPVDAEEPVRLQLHEECRLIVHLPEDCPPGAVISIKDGGKSRARADARGRTTVSFGGLGPGPGTASLYFSEEAIARSHQGGSRVTFDLAPGATEEVTFEPKASVEGVVTLEGEPASLAVVVAVKPDVAGEEPMAASHMPLATQMTGHDGRYRLEHLPTGPTRLEARAFGAMTVREVTIPESGSVVVDLEIIPVVLELLVTDDSDGSPLPAHAELVPEDRQGVPCTKSGNIMMLGGPFPQLMIDPCTRGATKSGGRVRLSAPEPERYALMVKSKGYEDYETILSLAHGTTAMGVELSRLPEEEEEEESEGTRVVVVVDIPVETVNGLLICKGTDRYGASSRSWPGTRGRIACGRWHPGPTEAVFHSVGYGAARVTFDVPEQDEPFDVALPVGRGGSVVVPLAPAESKPALMDRQGVDWGVILRHRIGEYRYVADVGSAWVFRDLPPGEYTAIVNGVSRAPVQVGGGESVVAW